MSIITLTSDLGDNNHYPAIIKGVILTHDPQALVVDVTHKVPDYDIMQAAWAARSCYWAFPPGTIHLIAVDPDATDTPTGVVMAYGGHWFVAPNNGILSLISDGTVQEGIEIARPDLVREQVPRSFRAARYLAGAAAWLSQGGSPEALGPRVPLLELRWGEPTYANNCLRGKIIHIDKFGNAVTNIRRQGFMDVRQERRFEIFIRSVRLRRIVYTYSDVGKADALAMFGESGHLEIAMREASAAQLLGLKVHDMISIEFSQPD